MGMYKYIKKAFQEPDKAVLRERLMRWRRQPAITRAEFPTNLTRARELGYRAKHGIIIIRVRVERGGHQRPKIKHGRRSAHTHRRLVLAKSYQVISEERAQKKYVNMEVLNSYKVGRDGTHYWYEVIMVDPAHSEIESDKTLVWMCSTKNTRRVHRGLTSAGKKSRGIHKGEGAEKNTPSKKQAYDRKVRKQGKK